MVALPRLGVGVSTEYGAQLAGGLDVMDLAESAPDHVQFLEVGVEIAKGLDADALAWIDAGRPTTYHFLDVNLDEPDDLGPDWLREVAEVCRQLKPAWLCGDAGMWHFGPRDRNHMLLLPPILTRESATDMAVGIRRLRDATGYEVLPENPPGQVFIGDMTLLEFFAEVCERADTGMLLDCAHLAIYQHLHGRSPLEGLDRFPLERVVELHVAGGTHREHDGFAWIDDDHTTAVSAETWAIFDFAVKHATNLKAVVFECERNQAAATEAGFARLAETLAVDGHMHS